LDSNNDKLEEKILLLTMKMEKKPEFKEDANYYKVAVKTAVELVIK